MSRYSILNSGMDARYHLKNEVGSSHMMGRMFVILTIVLSIFMASCGKGDNFDSETHTKSTDPSIRDEFLVDKIYDYYDNLLAEYVYDDNNKLTKRVVTDRIIEQHRTIDRKWEDKFEYKNGRVSKIKIYNLYIQNGQDGHLSFRDESNSEITFEYDKNGNLIKSRDVSFRYEKGRVAGIMRSDSGPFYITDTLVYDHSGNVVQHIHIRPELSDFGQPIPGTKRRDVRYYEYDNKPKPNFGLDYLFGYNPLPYTEVPDLQRALSKNNMTKATEDGYAFIYTYDENGLPETIETKWLGISHSPILLRITYKRIK